MSSSAALRQLLASHVRGFYTASLICLLVCFPPRSVSPAGRWIHGTRFPLPHAKYSTEECIWYYNWYTGEVPAKSTVRYCSLPYYRPQLCMPVKLHFFSQSTLRYTGKPQHHCRLRQLRCGDCVQVVQSGQRQRQLRRRRRMATNTGRRKEEDDDDEIRCTYERVQEGRIGGAGYATPGPECRPPAVTPNSARFSFSDRADWCRCAPRTLNLQSPTPPSGPRERTVHNNNKPLTIYHSCFIGLCIRIICIPFKFRLLLLHLFLFVDHQALSFLFIAMGTFSSWIIKCSPSSSSSWVSA